MHVLAEHFIARHKMYDLLTRGFSFRRMTLARSLPKEIFHASKTYAIPKSHHSRLWSSSSLLKQCCGINAVGLGTIGVTREGVSCTKAYWTQQAAVCASQLDNNVGVDVFDDRPEWANFAEQLTEDLTILLQKVAELGIADGPFESSVELCDDKQIAEYNKEWRNKDSPTDVLSFEYDQPPQYPYRLLGDITISVQTAERQAAERGHTVRDECRILMVHGILHTLGHDHEAGEEDLQAMEAQEQALLGALNWQGRGLIASASQEASIYDGERLATGGASTSSNASLDPAVGLDASAGTKKRRRDSLVKLLALDMDGTLLNGESQVLPSSVEALHAALSTGVKVCLATGKARPAALSAMEKVGLAGEGLVVSKGGPGLFLQGLAVHGFDGTLLEGPDLPAPIVQLAFQYATENNVPLAAFLGDECATLKLQPELEELHYRYYEPLCQEVASLGDLIMGPPVKKLLFMTDPSRIAAEIEPYWKAALNGQGADTTMAVPNMLEIVPRGINKWVGMQLLLEDLGIGRESLMSCGDGSNDLQLVSNSGIGVAMGNAVPAVKEAAKVIVKSNDDGGIAEAVERFIL